MMAKINIVVTCALLNIGFAISQTCPPQGVAYLPHPDCTKYIICSNGIPEVLDCPSGLYFSERISVCDYPQYVPECSGGTRPPVNGTTVTMPPTTQVTQITTTTERPPPVNVTKCGDKILSTSGRIQYKVNEQYSKSELCSFTIQLPQASGFLFTLNSHGINDTDKNSINIFTFDRAGLIHSTHMGPPSPLTTAYLEGSLAVIVFRTDTSKLYPGTGFDLSFEAFGSSSYVPGDLQNFNVSRDESGSLQVPAQELDLARGTLNAYVISSNYSIVEPSYYRLNLKIVAPKLHTCGDVMQCECDAIRVYSFLSNTLNQLELFCDERYHKSAFGTTGIYIVLVNFNEDDVDRRATLEWVSESW